MTTNEMGAPSGADATARAAALLQRYPELSSEELGALRKWFRKDASALDIGTLASDQNIAASYMRFRKEHIDKFGPKDLLILVVALAVVAGLIAWIAV